MNFPRWIRSDVTIAQASNADTEEICRRIARHLESRGATDIEIHDGKVHFRAERAMSNWNPLTPCREGAFRVEKAHDHICIEYELDMLYLLIWSSVVIPVMCIGSLIGLLQGDVVLSILSGAIFVAIIPLSHAFYRWRSKSLFANAAQPDGHP